MRAAGSILVFATQHMKTGGIESHLKVFCECLTDSGVVVDLLILNSEMTPDDEAFFRCKCRHVSLGKSAGWRRILMVAFSGFRARLRGYDAIYTNGQGNSVSLLAKIVKKRSRWVHHHHTSGDPEDQEHWPSSYQSAMEEADIVVACSTRNASEMAEKLKREVTTVPCFSRRVSTPRSENPTKDQLDFGYFGRLIPEKGIDQICRLAADPAVRGIRFHLWGEGDAYPPSFFEGHPGIRFHGTFTGAAGLDDVMRTLDGFLLLSVHPEGLPISLLEAMSGGLPWIATDRGGVADIAIDPSSTRLLPADVSYHAIRDAVLQLAEDLRKGAVSPGAQRELYERSFSSEVLVLRWKETLGLDIEEGLDA